MYLSVEKFAVALLWSPTFWGECVIWFGLGVGSFGGLLILLLRLPGRRRHESLLQDRSASVATQFLMSLPVLVLLGALGVQFLDAARSSLVLHHAAFAAARSALVNKCPPTSIGILTGGIAGVVDRLTCSDNPEAWTNAARVIATAMAPSSDAGYRNHDCRFPEALAQLALQGPVDRDLRSALVNKACYAQDSANLAVTVSWQADLVTALTPGSLPPIKALVEFRFPMVAPLGGLLSDGRHADGGYWRRGRAEVTLL